MLVEQFYWKNIIVERNILLELRMRGIYRRDLRKPILRVIKFSEKVILSDFFEKIIGFLKNLSS